MGFYTLSGLLQGEPIACNGGAAEADYAFLPPLAKAEGWVHGIKLLW
jgi:hypothetical protein